MTEQRQGTVSVERVALGSKSERDAVVLDTGIERFVLRRKGGNPFRDPALEQLVGKKLRALGDVHGSDFIMSEWQEVADGED
jgi:hypothetical protein